MFFAVWRREGWELPPRLGQGVAALLQRVGRERFDSSSASIAVWAPARFHRNGRSAVAQALSSGTGGWPPGHPTVGVERGALTISAGPLPQYPVYYARAEQDEYLLVCSQLEPLSSLFPNAPINAERLISLIDTLDPDADGTVFAGILRLRPCETLVANPDGIRLSRDFPRLGRTYRRGNPRDLAQELRVRLDDAVGRAVGASKRVAVFVSGGLDSSGILALAASRSKAVPGREVDAISLQCVGPGDDRAYFSELMTVHQQANAVRLSSQDAARWFAPCFQASQPLIGACACFSLVLAATATERRADVVLCGASGDTVCGRRLPSMQWGEWVRRGRVGAAIRAALQFRIPGGMSLWARLRYLLLSPLIPPVVRRVRGRLTRRPGWVTRRSRSLWARCSRRTQFSAGRLPDTPDAWMRELCTREYLADAADHGGEEAAITGCFPVDVFLDFEFVRFMLELDPILLCHGNEFRGLYRLAMKELLPDRLVRREDKARFEPAIGAVAVAADAIDTLHELSSLDALSSTGLVDPGFFRPTLKACIDAFRLGERSEPVAADDQLWQVWQLLSVEAFLRRHGRGRGLAWENQSTCISQ